MKKITAETERKLLDVIEKTASLVNDGLTPNDAIVKAATDGGLRPGEVSLVVHAFNTGRTTRQRQTSENIFSKAAEFDLADTGTVLEKMYPETVKTASALMQDAIISGEYSISPKSMLERKQAWEKRAQVVDWRALSDGTTITAPAPLPGDPKERVRKVASDVNRLQRTCEELRRQKSAAFDQLARSFNELTVYFRQPGATQIPVIKEAVALLHGAKGEQILDQLVTVTPGLTKMSSHSRQSVDDLDCTQEPFPTVARMISEIADYKTKKAAFENAVTTSQEESSKMLAPFADPYVSPSILGGSSNVRDKQAFDPLRPLGAYTAVKNTMGAAGRSIQDKADNPPELSKTLTALQDPAHEARLRGINAQAMLQDLMASDEVISGYDPHEVANAYNDIVQISPSVADQRMLIQTLLRKQLQQGQLDTFEQDQLLNFEDKLRKQNAPIIGQGYGDGSVI